MTGDEGDGGGLVLDGAFVRAAAVREDRLAGHPLARARTARVREAAARTGIAAVVLLVGLALPWPVPAGGVTPQARTASPQAGTASPGGAVEPERPAIAPEGPAIAPAPVRIAPAPVDLTPAAVS